MSNANFTPEYENTNNYKYNLTPFRAFCYEHFPFIEETFDSLTTYQLLQKIVKYLNEVITNQNTVQDNVTIQNTNIKNLLEAYNELQNYVNHYFDNLDVQEEINNKLNEMATDGTLEKIINQEIFGNINNSINELNTKIKKYERNALYIGNSYTAGTGSSSGNNGLFNLTKDLFDNAYIKTGGGIGFLPYKDHEDVTFNIILNNAINDDSIDNNSITDIIVIGAWRR